MQVGGPEREEARTYLDQLFGDRTGHLRFAFGVGGHHNGSGRYEFEKWQERHGRWPEHRDRFLDEALRRAETDDVYICPFLGSTNRRDQGSALPSHVLYVDDARGADDQRLMLVDSGGGKDDSFHAYALTTEEMESADLMAGNRRMRAAFGGDDKVSDNDVLRLPGTINHKTGNPVRLLRAGTPTPLEELGLPPDPGGTAEASDADPTEDFDPSTLPPSIRRRLDEEPGDDRSAQTASFLSECRRQGVADSDAIAAVLHHRPTLARGKSEAWIIEDAKRILGKFEDEPEASSPVESSWLAFTDLLAFEGLPPVTPDVAGLAYCGQRNLWSGPSESGKTWAALAASVEEINDGRYVLWIDTDGMGERAILERLLTLGASREAIGAHFRYVVPSDKLTRPVVEAVIACLGGRLVVVDSFNATMGLRGRPE